MFVVGKDGDDSVNDRLIWVDLEMSGLEVEKERIIEMAVSVTDGNLTMIAEVSVILIGQSYLDHTIGHVNIGIILLHIGSSQH